jgi:hypothetical protein
VLVGTLVWMALEGGVFKAVALGGIYAALLGSLFIFVFRAQQKEIAELRRLLALAADNHRSPAAP